MAKRILEAVDAIYATALEPSRWPQTLQIIADCTDDFGAVLIYGRDDGSFGVINSPSLDPCIREYARQWDRRDVRANRALERGFFVNRDVITDRDILSESEMHTEPFYADFLHRHGLKYFAAAMVSPDPHVAVAVSVQRALGRPLYSEEELNIVRTIGYQVERALRLSIRLMDAELVNIGLGQALARIGIGVFVLDSLQRVVFSNPFGQRLLGDDIDVVNERLQPAHAQLRESVEAAIAAVIDGGPKAMLAAPRPILIPRPSSNRPLTLYVMPIAMAASAGNRFLTHARAIVLLVDPEIGGPPDPSLVRDLLGLTLGEARVAALIGSGVPPREAAARLGIVEDTVRSVLKRVFIKTGVSRQSELAALLTRLVLR